MLHNQDSKSKEENHRQSDSETSVPPDPNLRRTRAMKKEGYQVAFLFRVRRSVDLF